jgi:hypothetical protein
MNRTLSLPLVRVGLAAAALAFSAAGCQSHPRAARAAQTSSGAASGPSAAEATAEAQQIFATRCTPCHGESGGGDGPASAALTPKPRNFHDKTWQGSVPDEHIEKIIAYGGAAVGKSAAMPPNPDLADKHEVLGALRARVRGFGQ